MVPIEKLEAMLSAEPGDPFLLYALAQAHAGRGEHARAVEYYDRCLAVDPASLYSYFHKAMSLRELGRRGDAVAALRLGVAEARSRGDAKAHSELAGLLDEMG